MKRLARRSSVVAVLFLTTGALLGGLVGNKVQAEAERPDDAIWNFGRILALVEDRFVGEFESEEMVESAVAGMLQTLDPHSNFLGAEAFREMRDEQRGRFYGLGIQITKRGADKPLTIIAPIDDTPAYRAGLQSGDIIAEIEGEPTMELTVQEAVRLLKGDRGTEVTITVERPGTPEPFPVTIERDEIPIESIRLAYMIEPGVGFIRISNFTSTTADELDAAIEELTAQGMDRLLLDLRGNPGGLLDQAVQVAERFLPPNELVVYTRGRIPGSNQDFRAKRGVERVDLPLVVLVDGSSASASEIVSGAVQDHDRGLVVGETTFGKGLVQRVIPLREGGALAVTTAKYYTPAGRLIQRDYSDLEEYYLSRGEETELSEVDKSDDESSPEGREIFYTDSGRKVYGGGGIHPDYVIENERPPRILLDLLRENSIFDYAVLYVNAHPELAPGFRANEEVPVDAASPKITDMLLADFKEYLDGRDIDVDEEAFEAERELIGLRLRAQIARVKWDQVEEARILAEADPQIREALRRFVDAAKLAKIEMQQQPTDLQSKSGSTL